MLLTQYLILLIACLYKVYSMEMREKGKLKSALREKLDTAERNAICCSKSMRCCKKPSTPPKIEIKAILARCPSSGCDESFTFRNIKRPICSSRELDIKRFQGFDADEPLMQSDVRNCHKKLLITMRIKNKGYTNIKNEFIVVDHVYDPLSEQSSRLLNPYVIKIKQEQISQIYKLKFQSMVNSEAKEVVYSKNSPNFTGCFTENKKPSCGEVKYKGKRIPYSTGFCCSCDSVKNAQLQPDSPTSSDPIVIYSDPAFLLDGVECPQNLKTSDIRQAIIKKYLRQDQVQTNNDNRLLNMESNKMNPIRQQWMENLPQVSLEFVGDDYKKFITNITRSKQKGFDGEPNEYNGLKASSTLERTHNLGESERCVGPNCGQFGPDVDAENLEMEKDSLLDNIDAQNQNGGNFLRRKRQVMFGGTQQRGGQNCADRYTPPKLDPEKYHESAHCLRFSDLWYTVYSLQEPILDHSVYMQIFEKNEGPDGEIQWRDVTKGKMVHVGNFVDHFIDNGSTISIRYKPEAKSALKENSLNHKNLRLLVPEVTKDIDKKKHPEVTGGPKEYLVVYPNQIATDGDLCNVAGVGFEAFYKQPNRCSVPRGSCLANQPKNLWKHDHEAEKLGKKGCFFLKHYGNLSANPIRCNNTKGDKYLALQYQGTHKSVIEMEIKADFNTVLRRTCNAKITEVYIDSTNPTKTHLIVKVTNSGLVSNYFSTAITDCPLELPTDINNIRSKPCLIAPQQQHVFNLEIDVVLTSDRFHCSAEVLNSKLELVAIRRIRIQKFDRCICTWHCLCACVGSVEGLKCRPMSLEHYHAAGFQGALPVPTEFQQYDLMSEILSWTFYAYVFFLLTLFLMGLTKGIIGCCCSTRVGIWGLDVLLDFPKTRKAFYDHSSPDQYVKYDDCGWPIYPKAHRVPKISKPAEFCLNFMFFYTYPVAVLFFLTKRVCFPYYTYEVSSKKSANVQRLNKKKKRKCGSQEVISFEKEEVTN